MYSNILLPFFSHVTWNERNTCRRWIIYYVAAAAAGIKWLDDLHLISDKRKCGGVEIKISHSNEEEKKVRKLNNCDKEAPPSVPFPL